MKKKKIYYFDNSTTSFPKPKEVAKEMSNFIMNIGGTYGRVNTERGKETTKKIEECREAMADILGVKNSSNVIFTSGATRAINDILIGLDLHDTKILISSLEHNAVLRPIYQLSKNKNVEYQLIPSINESGLIDIEKLSDLISDTKNKISLVIVNMESNISGVIQPIKKIKETIGNIPLIVDATQSVGIHQIKADNWNVDFLVFTGHKGLLGPTGTGGFYVKNDKILNPAYFGGGFGDEYETPYSVPEIYESGTPNTVGIIGLLAALTNKPNWKINTDDLIETIKEIESMNKYNVIWAKNKKCQGFLFSITPKTTKNGDINMANLTYKLYNDYNIECRYGFHCAFLAHNFYGSKEGAIRFSFSPYTEKEDLKYLINALGDKL